ncbi:MAG: hypothetical protein QOH68_1457, partial [Nocardioidaceae bacterium]|nr:hypothetical protein [Nocardioidaceae bacterium]
MRRTCLALVIVLLVGLLPACSVLGG